MCNWGWFGAGQGESQRSPSVGCFCNPGEKEEGRIQGEKRRTWLRRHLGLELDGVTDTGLVALRLGPPKCRL